MWQSEKIIDFKVYNLLVHGRIISTIAISCEEIISNRYNGYEYNEGDLPDTPVNLENFNTTFDDYNASAP